MDMNIGAASYATAAAAFSLLALALAAGWRGSVQGALLAGSCMVSAVWAGVLAYGVAHPYHGLAALTNPLEVLRSAAWFLVLGSLLWTLRPSDAAVRARLRLTAAVLLGFCLLVLAATVYFHVAGRQEAGQGRFVTDILSRVILAVTGMALVEQLFRNAHPERRWGIKFLCLGVGGMFAYDFFLYSDAMLFRHIDQGVWAARGFVNALVAPLIMVSAARNPQWTLDVHVSRRMVFHSATLLGAGVYLLVMAAAGYALRAFGGTWGTVLQAAFLFGALLLLLVLLFSGTMRAQLKVFLSKHFFSYRYDYREEWLRLIRTLSEGDPGRPLGESAVKALAQLVESPGGGLWMQEGTDGYVKRAQWNMTAEDAGEPADGPLVRFLEKRQWVISLEEYKNTPEMYGDLALPPWLLSLPRAWLVVPLMLQERLLGFVVLARSRGKAHFNWEVSDLLKTAGYQVASLLAQRQAAEALVVAHQFDSFNRMSAFVVHDLKNLVAQLSLMLSNAERHRDNPEFLDDMISTVENSVEKMNRLLGELRGRTSPGHAAEVDLAELLRETVKQKASLKPRPELKVVGDGFRVTADRERLLRVIGHIVQNAGEATPYDGEVEVRLAAEGGCAKIEIQDTGSGMDEQFIQERLFRPFDSTKGSGMGIGAHECREYIRELGGRVQVTSAPSRGTLFQIIVPLARENGDGDAALLEQEAGS